MFENSLLGRSDYYLNSQKFAPFFVFRNLWKIEKKSRSSIILFIYLILFDSLKKNNRVDDKMWGAVHKLRHAIREGISDL